MMSASRRDCPSQLGGLCDIRIASSYPQLVKDKSRAEEYLHQSLPYLKDPQATVREVAVRFIGESQLLETRFGQPGPCFCRCTALSLLCAGSQPSLCHHCSWAWWPLGSVALPWTAGSSWGHPCSGRRQGQAPGYWKHAREQELMKLCA